MFAINGQKWPLSCLFAYFCMIFIVLIQPATAGAHDILVAATCSQVDVQTAIDLARDGDIVQIPAGIATWMATTSNTPCVLVEKKAITIRGGGMDQTIIVDETGSSWNETPLIIQEIYGKPFRISQITFQTHGCPLTIKGTCKKFRVDHCRFEADEPSYAIHTYGYTYGVIDHCNFSGTEVLVTGDDEDSWNRPLSLGTKDAVYIEDCDFEEDKNEDAVDGQGGGRYVFRHSTVMNMYIHAHGRDTSGMRSTLSYEIYDNQFQATTSRYRGIFLRGGTGVIFNNRFNGPYAKFHVTNYTSCGDIASFDRCMEYPCIDQIGRSSGQVLEPLYEWDNTVDGKDMNLSVYNFTDCPNPSVNDHIQEGRDFYSNTPRPGYSPYLYPHPDTFDDDLDNDTDGMDLAIFVRNPEESRIEGFLIYFGQLNDSI